MANEFKVSDYPIKNSKLYIGSIFYILAGAVLSLLAFSGVFYGEAAVLLAFLFFPTLVALVVAIVGNPYCALNILLFNLVSATPYIIQFILNHEHSIEYVAHLISQDQNLTSSLLLINGCGLIIYNFLPRIIRYWLIYSVKKQRMRYVRKAKKIAEEWNINGLDSISDT